MEHIKTQQTMAQIETLSAQADQLPEGEQRRQLIDQIAKLNGDYQIMAQTEGLCATADQIPDGNERRQLIDRIAKLNVEYQSGE
ncbi:MAG: hypothetical protein ABSH01_00980 [Terriglobia bacterium]|jgi:hypothetical protein